MCERWIYVEAFMCGHTAERVEHYAFDCGCGQYQDRHLKAQRREDLCVPCWKRIHGQAEGIRE